MVKWQCTVCGYIYDEADEGVPFDSLPDSWACPMCTAPKAVFEPMEETAPAAEEAPAAAAETGGKKYVCTVCGYIYDEAAEGVPFDSLPDSWACPMCTAPKAVFEPMEEAAPAAEEAPAAVPEQGGKKYVCTVCGYIYDEAVEGVPFDSLPDSWACPMCTAPKAVFEPVGEPEEQAPAASSVPDTDMKELTPGELAAVFSNLARGCEKQYQGEESRLFLQLAAYFEAITPAEETPELQALSDLIRDNLSREYPNLEAVCRQEADRGALRAYTWGSKVTRMQQAVVGQYLREGEAFLEHTNVWICTVCGFIYIGENPPALCPVCKVPDWKFEKIQGGRSV